MVVLSLNLWGIHLTQLSSCETVIWFFIEHELYVTDWFPFVGLKLSKL